MSRSARIERVTKETTITVEVDLDGDGNVDVDTGVPFFDHMLDQLGRHGRLDLAVHADGDTEIDDHHTVEDVGIAIGQALAEAWGDRAGVERFGDATVPIDECLTRTAVDLAGRPYLVWHAPVALEVIGTFETSLVKHFFESVVANSRMTLHVRLLEGGNTHHVFESVFKSFAVALRRAVAVTAGDAVPSTKGTLQ